MTDIKPKKIEADRNALANIVQLGQRRCLWFYAAPESHTFRDIIKENYFRAVALDFGVRDRDLVDIIVGDPAEGLHARLCFIWPVRLGPQRVSIVYRHRATPVAHDGDAIEEAA